MAFKQRVDQVVLISGDAGFLPAAMLTRQEGIDFVLDPVWQDVPEDLLADASFHGSRHRSLIRENLARRTILLSCRALTLGK